MTTMHASPQAISSAPPAITEARSDTAPIETKTTVPTSAPANPILAPRRNTPPTRSTPTSSVIQAWYAPLVKV